MIRPAERFAVSVSPAAPSPDSSPRKGAIWSGPALLMVALLVGGGIGGLVPTNVWRLGTPEFAAIEPAAGPATPADPLLVARAPDGGFYVSAGLDRVPIVVRLEPTLPHSVLRAADAARVAPAEPKATTLEVSQLALGGLLRGPVRLQVADADVPASILGADVLDQFTVDGLATGQLRLTDH